MTATSPDVLFRPLSIRSLELANRIVMPAMTRLFAPSGVPGEANAEYYRKRAEGGAGLILSEGTVIDRPASRNEPCIPFFHGNVALAGWRRVIEESGQNMGVIFVVAARAKVSSLRGGLSWTYGLQSKLPSTTGRSALISLKAFLDPTG